MHIDYWKGYADGSGVRAGERLSNVAGGMSQELSEFLLYLNRQGLSQTVMASILNHVGVKAADGGWITNSNVSNTMRKALDVRRAPKYSKDNYKGRNWITCTR